MRTPRKASGLFSPRCLHRSLDTVLPIGNVDLTFVPFLKLASAKGGYLESWSMSAHLVSAYLK